MENPNTVNQWIADLLNDENIKSKLGDLLAMVGESLSVQQIGWKTVFHKSIEIDRTRTLTVKVEYCESKMVAVLTGKLYSKQLASALYGYPIEIAHKSAVMSEFMYAVEWGFEEWPDAVLEAKSLCQPLETTQGE